MTLNPNEKKRHCRVNSTVCVDSLAAKDRCGGFDWQAVPAAEELGKHAVDAGFEVREVVKVQDVDGIVKQVLKTTYLDSDGDIRKKPAYGVYMGDGWRYHGGKSRNWKAAQLTADEVIEALNDGVSVTPGRFEPARGQSRRSAETLKSVDFLLMDGDEWSDACPPPASIDELLNRYPTLESTFYWIGESISSRSALKPEMRFRLLALFPEEIPRTDLGRAQFLEIIESLLSEFPFLARGPSTDMVRLAYGNARVAKKTAVLHGHITAERLAAAKERAETLLDARAKAKAEREARAERRRAVSAKAVRGATPGGASKGEDPLDTFLAADVRGLLEKNGFTYLRATGNGDEYRYDKSGPGRSCIVSGDILKPYSNTVSVSSPAGENEPVNVARFLIWNLYQMDLKGITGKNMHELKQRLASDGYGVYEPPRRRRRIPPVMQLSPERTVVQGAEVEAVRGVLVKDVKTIVKEKVPKGTVLFYHVGADTGSGKTHTILANAGDLLFCAPHGDLADEAMETIVKLGREDAVRWVSRYHGFKEGFEAAGGDRNKLVSFAFEVVNGKKVMCPFADLAEALVKRGRMPGGSICLNCPLKKDCEVRGYRSQYFEALASSAVFIALPEMQLLLDGDWKELASQIGKERLAIIDDAAVWELSVRRSVSMQILREMRAHRNEEWSDGIQREVAFQKSESGEFITKLHAELSAVLINLEQLTKAGKVSSAIFNAMKAAYADYTPKQWKKILWQLARTPVYIKFHCIDPMTDTWEAEDGDGHRYPVTDDPKHEWGVPSSRLVRTGVWKRWWLSDAEIAAMPAAGFEALADVNRFKPVSAIGSGWAASLGRFIESVGDGENAPLGWVSKPGEVEWFVQPAPNFEKTVYLSATADEELVKKMMTAPKVRLQSMPGAPLALQAGSEIFQLSTGRMTEASFFSRAGGEIVGPGPRLADLCALIQKQVDLGDKVLLVGLKALSDAESLSVILSPIRKSANVTILNYGEIVGLNDYADEFNLIFLMLPEPSPGELESAARRLYRGDEKPLNFKRDERTLSVCGVTVRKQVNVDDRVRAVHMQIIRQKMYQAAMRLRPMLLENKKIVLLTNEPVPGLTDRDITLFSWEQALAAADIRDVGTVSLQGDIKEAVRDGEEVQSVSAAMEVSEKTVRRAGGNAQAAKERRNARIRAAAEIGMSMSEIAAEEGISRRQVGRILKG